MGFDDLMIIDMPFFENHDGNQCMQVTMKIVLKHFLDKDFSLEELDKLTGRKKGFWTWTSQIVPVLYDLGLEVKYYSKTDLEPFLEGETFIRRHFGKDAEKILKYADLPVVMNSIRKSLKYRLFEKKVLSINDIESHIQDRHVPLVLIDHNKIIGKNDFYQGHFVVVTGFDEENIYYHESGPTSPQANRKVKKGIFSEAMNANGTDNDVVIVFGERQDN